MWGIPKRLFLRNELPTSSTEFVARKDNTDSSFLIIWNNNNNYFFIDTKGEWRTGEAIIYLSLRQGS